MPAGLQYNDERERQFAAEFARRHHAMNRRSLLLVNAVTILWLAWVATSHVEGLSWHTLRSVGLVALIGAVLALGLSLSRLRQRSALILGFYCLILQIVLIEGALGDRLTGLMAPLLIPMFLPALVFRLRFVYVLPFTLGNWMLSFVAMNFLIEGGFFAYSQWAFVLTTLMIALLVGSYQFELEARGRFEAEQARDPERAGTDVASS